MKKEKRINCRRPLVFLFYLSADLTLSNIWRRLSEAMKSSSVGQRLVFGAPSDFSAPI